MANCHLVATVFMVGLIWFVQVVHYPLFNRISGDASIQYAAEHQRRTAWVVGLPMLVEGITTLWLFFNPIDGRLLPLLGGLVLLKIHLSTIFLQIPLHKKLSQGYEREVVRKLVATNWVRTIGWTIRAAIAVVIVV
ncbi:MAG: hypothetical protein CL417_02385 [Acidimicrobiaceae bacterium]|nr:hypothetical protein [Acidimicrobiaceae bacterium]|tara:strand:+ start:288 stop:695 length:408 start_codon:yes stop_codon:yes gene_type:complete